MSENKHKIIVYKIHIDTKTKLKKLANGKHLNDYCALLVRKFIRANGKVEFSKYPQMANQARAAIRENNEAIKEFTERRYG